MPCLTHPYFRQRRNTESAFTLVEISLAIGIFAFAIVAILALFPLGLKSASESREQSIVTQIARTILSDLRTGTFTAARIYIKPLPDNPTGYKPYDLSAATGTTVYLLYKADGKVIEESSLAKYDTGDASGDYLAKVDSKKISAGPPVLTQVTITVEAPAVAPQGRRNVYPVVTLMGDTR